MKTRIGATVLTVLLAFCGAVDARPPDYTIQLNLRATTGHPTSAIVFEVTMGLMIEAQDGDNIGWDVISVTIRELNVSGEVVHTWYKTNPFVNTADGLWWIEHADPASPANSEFLVLPWIAGTAPSMNPTEASLEFDFEGDIYVAPPEGAPFEDTASLTTLLQEEGNPKPPPKKDESDEPVEVPNQPEEPFPI